MLIFSHCPKPPPLQGEGRGGDGFFGIKAPHPPPNLPLEGGGTNNWLKIVPNQEQLCGVAATPHSLPLAPAFAVSP
ncbi:MAG TPA: hypothetical protein DDY22_00375 [Geobacter sp.]|nr:hypothetical protein [Geobacter sp.]